MKVILSIIVVFSCILLTCNAQRNPCTRVGAPCVVPNAAVQKHLSNDPGNNPIAAAAEAQRLSLLRNQWGGRGYEWRWESGSNTVFFHTPAVNFRQTEIQVWDQATRRNQPRCHCVGDLNVPVYKCTNVPTRANPVAAAFCRPNATPGCLSGPFDIQTGHLHSAACP